MIRKIIEISHSCREVTFSYKEEFYYPLEIKPTKVTGINTTATRARSTLTVGHRRRGDVGGLFNA